MNFAIAAAVTAVLLLVVSQIERRMADAPAWLGKSVIALRLLVLVFVGLYLYFRLTA
ncbi:hypothetical protein ACFFUB_12460 [Algimonas porphyrae]|uniref:Uncharacterized protein n=1 Tax=Algimonas porphyrae TaxID=1128113 RepID=A0ABQ5UXC3_9PROT|nr:hypothetical protein [Algimonas porphyrae]GLQ19223.1 hypothetical protein GCM10007854_01780 [Algimonas porphyrae]